MHRLKINKAHGPNGLPSEPYKWLNEDNRSTLLRHLNTCWESEALDNGMNDANLATIYKKGHTDRPAHYSLIALLNITFTLLAIIIRVRSYETIDENINKTQFGFRKNESTAQPLFIYRRIQELQKESASAFHTLLLDWERVSTRSTNRERFKLLND